MVVTLPGYNCILLSMDENTRGVYVFTDHSVVAWSEAGEEVIMLAPQLSGWEEKSALQTIKLTKYFMENYSVYPSRVYAIGYSPGGETIQCVEYLCRFVRSLSALQLSVGWQL